MFPIENRTWRYLREEDRNNTEASDVHAATNISCDSYNDETTAKYIHQVNYLLHRYWGDITERYNVNLLSFQSRKGVVFKTSN